MNDFERGQEWKRALDLWPELARVVWASANRTAAYEALRAEPYDFPDEIAADLLDASVGHFTAADRHRNDHRLTALADARPAVDGRRPIGEVFDAEFGLKLQLLHSIQQSPRGNDMNMIWVQTGDGHSGGSSMRLEPGRPDHPSARNLGSGRAVLYGSCTKVNGQPPQVTVHYVAGGSKPAEIVGGSHTGLPVDFYVCVIGQPITDLTIDHGTTATVHRPDLSGFQLGNPNGF